MKKRVWGATLIAVVALPLLALANVGTPLMWAGMLHLAVGNLFIGLLEGFLLAKLFGVSKRKAIGLLIVANYFSAWVGGLLLNGAIVRAFPLDLNNAWGFLWAMVIFTYLMTIVFELPFVALAFYRDPKWLRKALRGSFLIQSVSYLLLFGWFWMVSGTSLYTQAKVVVLSAISLPEKVLLYFIASDDGNVYKLDLASAEKNMVYELGSTSSSASLYFQPSSTSSNQLDLIARMETRDYREPRLVTVGEGLSTVDAAGWDEDYGEHASEVNAWLDFGPARRLGAAKDSPWHFFTGFWAAEGLTGTQTNSGERVSLAFETPFGEWQVRNATLLPTDKVLFQLGWNQICVYDPVAKRVALVVKGQGLVAVMDEE
jgi:hypothetical protein